MFKNEVHEISNKKSQGDNVQGENQVQSSQFQVPELEDW